MATTITDPRFAVGYVGRNSNASQRIASLTGAGPLPLAPEHLAVQLMPDAWDKTTHAPKVTAHQMGMHGMIIPGAILSPELSRYCMHWAVDKDRLAQFWKDLCDAGLNMTPIPGAYEEAMPVAVKRITEVMMTLSLAQRMINTADVNFDEDEDDPKTGTYFDYITAALVMGGGGGMVAVASFMGLLPFVFNNDGNLGRGSGSFTDIVSHMQGSVGRDISNLPQAGQAAEVANWHRRTIPPPAFMVYINPDEVQMEIARKANPSASGRFEPLFALKWRQGYQELNDLWPDTVEDPVAAAVALASAIGEGQSLPSDGGITPAAAIAIGVSLKGLLPFAVSSGNAKRTAEVQAAARTAKAATDGGESMNAEARAQLQSSNDYTDLKDEAAACGDDYPRMAKKLLFGKHPAGFQFMNSKLSMSEKFWKEKAGARTDSVVQSVFNDALSYDTAGEKQQWGSIVTVETAKALVAHKLVNNWWTWFRMVVAKREGRHIVDAINSRIAHKPAKSFWSDPERLRYCEVPARECMRIVRLNEGPADMSFPAWYKMTLRMATGIDNLPETCTSKEGLRRRLEEACVMVLQATQDRSEATLATPANAATRAASMVEKGQGLDAMHAVAKQLARIQEDVEDGHYGLARNANNNSWDAFNTDDWSGERPNKRQRREQEWEAGGEKDGIVWGSAAKHGILSEPDGKRLAFGSVISTYETAPDCKQYCAARFAPGKRGRDKWCLTPKACWDKFGSKAHERIADFGDDVCKGVDCGNVPNLDWATFTKVLAKPGGDDGGRGRRGRGAGGRGGKGGGKGGGAGGKGKGGKGKGGKGGKGKGGGSNFGRQ